MTKKEFYQEEERLKTIESDALHKLLNLYKVYYGEVLKRNGFIVGERISVNGKEYEIAYVSVTTEPWLTGFPIKKDGTPSKREQIIHGITFDDLLDKEE